MSATPPPKQQQQKKKKNKNKNKKSFFKYEHKKNAYIFIWKVKQAVVGELFIDNLHMHKQSEGTIISW